MEVEPEQVRVVGNLPYFITSDILLRLFEFSRYFERIVIMVQREVADRIAAEPGGSEYGVSLRRRLNFMPGWKVVYFASRRAFDRRRRYILRFCA